MTADRTTHAPTIVWLCAVLLASVASPVSAQEDRHTRAVRLFEESETAFAEHRYEAAAALLREAHALEPEPVLLYNLARAYEELGDDDRALEAIDAYLATDLDARSRTEALERRGDIAGRIALRPPPPTPDHTTPETGVAHDDGEAIPIGLVVAGAVLAVTAAALAIASEVEHARASDPNTSAYGAIDALHARDALAIARDVLGAAGAVAAVGGGIWFVLVPRAAATEAGASLRLGGTF